jgi:hypothetical protein
VRKSASSISDTSEIATATALERSSLTRPLLARCSLPTLHHLLRRALLPRSLLPRCRNSGYDVLEISLIKARQRDRYAALLS